MGFLNQLEYALKVGSFLEWDWATVATFSSCYKQLCTFLTPSYTGCWLGLGTKPGCLLGLGTIFTTSWRFWAQKNYFGNVFNDFGVCVVGTFVLILCNDSAYIPGFWVRCFQTLFIKMLKVFFKMPIFIVFAGLTPIDGRSKRLLQAFNFKSFLRRF